MYVHVPLPAYLRGLHSHNDDTAQEIALYLQEENALGQNESSPVEIKFLTVI